jgi:hypothetical protein
VRVRTVHLHRGNRRRVLRPLVSVGDRRDRRTVRVRPCRVLGNRSAGMTGPRRRPLPAPPIGVAGRCRRSAPSSARNAGCTSRRRSSPSRDGRAGNPPRRSGEGRRHPSHVLRRCGDRRLVRLTARTAGPEGRRFYAISALLRRKARIDKLGTIHAQHGRRMGGRRCVCSPPDVVGNLTRLALSGRIHIGGSDLVELHPVRVTSADRSKRRRSMRLPPEDRAKCRRSHTPCSAPSSSDPPLPC